MFPSQCVHRDDDGYVERETDDQQVRNRREQLANVNATAVRGRRKQHDLAEVGLAKNLPDNRHDDVGDQRVYHATKRRTDDDADRKLDRVATADEGTKSIEHHSLLSDPLRARLRPVG